MLEISILADYSHFSEFDYNSRKLTHFVSTTMSGVSAGKKHQHPLSSAGFDRGAQGDVFPSSQRFLQVIGLFIW